MKNFTAYNPVKLHFGKDVTDKIGKSAKRMGKNVLLIYGGGSVVKYGYFDIIMHRLKQEGLNVVEYAGIKPNPILKNADEAVKLADEQNIDLIVALGGGSVIDTAKYVAVAVPEKLKVWDIVKGKSKPTKALPIISVLTLAATGTEMNPFAVIQNQETKEKLGYGSELMYPKESFSDPQFTYSVPKNQTTYGIVDLIAHSLENFFGAGDSPLTDRFTVSIIKEAMEYAPKLLSEPENYEYRANVMFQATTALNGMTAWGKSGGDWGVHGIGHTLSALYDTAHGASLSVAYLAWFKHFKEKQPERFQKLSSLLFGMKNVDEMIQKFQEFFKKIEAPICMADIDIDGSKKEEIIELMKDTMVNGMNFKMDVSDYEAIIDLMYS
ncbi:MAG: iron-containing alcohol dehydrogenase [Bacteroidota bacterium]|nr:iron-containing alcohol dehydrogenase [Bacteroidota bacterium]